VVQHRAWADDERVRDLLVTLAGGEETQHFDLTGRESV
jgi:hypothetical protein